MADRGTPSERLPVPHREASGLRRGQANYLIVKLKKQGRDAWSVRALDDSFVVFSLPAMKALRV